MAFLISTAVVQYLAPEAEGHGTEKVIGAIHKIQRYGCTLLQPRRKGGQRSSGHASQRKKNSQLRGRAGASPGRETPEGSADGLILRAPKGGKGFLWAATVLLGHGRLCFPQAFRIVPSALRFSDGCVKPIESLLKSPFFLPQSSGQSIGQAVPPITGRL